MAWLLVQGLKSTPTGTVNATVAATFASNVTTGNRLFMFTVHDREDGNTDNTKTPAKSGGTATVSAFTKLAAGFVANSAVQSLAVTIWTATVTTGGTLTLSCNNTAVAWDELGWTASEYSGLDGSAGAGCLDVSAAGTGNKGTAATASTGVTGVTGAAGQLGLALVGDYGVSATWTLATANGFTKDASASIDGSAVTSIGVATKTSAGGASESCIWTNGGVSDLDVACVAVVKAAGSGSTTKVTGTRASTWQVLIGPAKTVAGTVTPAGSEHRAPAKRPAGVTAGAGGTVKSGLVRALTGTTAPVGAKLAAILGRRLYALVVPAGVTQRGYPRTVSGSVVAAATLSRRLMGRFPAGAVTAVGSLRRGFARTVTATVTGQAPSPKRFTAKRQASVSSPLGVAGRVAIRFRTYTGQITAAGLTLHRALGVKTGQLTGTGLLKPRTVWKVPKGSVRAVGVAVHVAFQRVFGRAGTATSTLTAAAETDTLIYQRQRAVITVSAVDTAAAVTSWREV